MQPPPSPDARILAIERPDAILLFYYFIRSLGALVLFPFVVVPLTIKYYTLRYRFDAEGISMRWGFFFRREINLTYRRIQDIHLSRGILERWLGIASLSIQTASGAAGAEMTIQGLREYKAIRDFLYERMRGHDEAEAQGAVSPAPSSEALELLRAIHADLQAVRHALRPAEEAPGAAEAPPPLTAAAPPESEEPPAGKEERTDV